MDVGVGVDVGAHEKQSCEKWRENLTIASIRADNLHARLPCERSLAVAINRRLSCGGSEGFPKSRLGLCFC